MLIRKSEDIQRYNLNILIYGESGTGKTYATRTIDEKILFVNCESGMLSLKGEIFDYINISSLDEFVELYNYLKANEGKNEHTTIVIDSLSEISKIIKEDITKQNGHEIPTLQDYLKITEFLRKYIRKFRDLEYNIIFISLQKVEEDKTSGQINVIPDIVGQQLPREMCGYMDIVGYTYTSVDKDPQTNKDEIKYKVLFTKHPNFIAKNRGGELDNVKELNYSEIFKLCRTDNAKTKEKETVEKVKAEQKEAKNKNQEVKK